MMDTSEFNLKPRSVTPTEEGFNWDKYLCHSTGNEGTLTEFTAVRWKKLEQSAEIRQDDVSEILKTRWNEGPRGGYHRPCYQEYTHKHKLDRIQRKRKSEAESAQASTSTYEEPTVKRTSRSSHPGRDYEKCIICQHDKISKKNRRKLERVVKLEQDQSTARLVNAAEIRKDKGLLLHIKDKDLPALNVKYHKSCYDDYVKTRTITSINVEIENTENTEETSQCYDTAFQMLAGEVHQNVIVQLDVMKISTLRLRYVELLLNIGIDAPEYRTEKLKKRLTNHFGDQIEFWFPSVHNEAEFIFAKTVEKGHIIEAGVSAVTTASSAVPTEVVRDTGEDSVVQSYHCVKYIRKLLKDVECSIPCPPTPEDLTEDIVNLPVHVYNFLAWIMSDVRYFDSPVEERVVIPDTLHQNVISVGQDLLHITTNDRVKTPKHIVLPMTVKNLTGSSQLITILNRFGHGISCSQVQEIETAVAESALDRQTGEVLVPSNAVHNVFATFCWDNNDINEETLTGRDTMHSLH